MEKNQVRVVQSFVEAELLWKLQHCLVGESATVCDTRSMDERLTKFGLGEILVKRIQGRFFLIEVPDEEFMEVLKQNDWAYLKECFIKIEPWSEKRFFQRRWHGSTLQVSHCIARITRRLKEWQIYGAS
ncbi:hypothetical protein J1N35_036011 [Gossypium stocksii]|uniref:DUF4283 domain-containing protein n=1 Tax=Gossypium stocksii TaxID=47602 RepID=A0A9D3UUX3_9ROSI|nr:hypothetical protein J1N35_036011 [Gossypium stocksii]